MDPVSLALTIINIIKEVKNVAEEVSSNRESCLILAKRFEGLQPLILSLSQIKGDNTAVVAASVLECVQDAREFMAEFQTKPGMLKKMFGYVEKIANRKRNAQLFLDINARLDRHLLDLGAVVSNNNAQQLNELLKQQAQSRMDAIQAMFLDMKDEMIKAVNKARTVVSSGQSLPEDFVNLSSDCDMMVRDITDLATTNQISLGGKGVEQTSLEMKGFVDREINELMSLSRAAAISTAAAAAATATTTSTASVAGLFTGKTVKDDASDIFEGCGGVDGDRLGDAGAFGVTYRRRCVVNGLYYALKKIDIAQARRLGADRDRVVEEAAVLQQFHHPNIVGCYHSFFSDSGNVFNIVMELVTGGSIHDRIGQKLSDGQLLKWLKQLASALVYMHGDLNIVHRDLKPQNILLTAASEEIKIIDFGLARLLPKDKDRDNNKLTKGVGTAMYSSPEKNDGEGYYYDGRDDIWAVGVILLELGLGRHITGSSLCLKSEEARKRALVAELAIARPVLGALAAHLLVADWRRRSRATDLLVLVDMAKASPTSLKSWSDVDGFIVSATASASDSGPVAALASISISLQSQTDSGAKSSSDPSAFTTASVSSRGKTKDELMADMTEWIISHCEAIPIEDVVSYVSAFDELGATTIKVASAELASGDVEYVKTWKKPHKKQFVTALARAGLLRLDSAIARECIDAETAASIRSSLPAVAPLKVTTPVTAPPQPPSVATAVKTVKTSTAAATAPKPSVSEKVTYANGDVYEGALVNGKKNGHGKLTRPDGAFYEGSWKNDKKEGQGKYTYITGNIYEGEWKDDAPNGQGRKTFGSGTVYEGSWKDGKEDGQGKRVYGNGDAYEGSWKENKKHGPGRMTYSSGNVFESVWTDDKMGEHVKILFEGGNVYDGLFSDGKRNGLGTLKYSNGNVYSGSWIVGNREGLGKMVYADGGVYEGGWKDNVREGQGKMTYADGNVYEGVWKDNKPLIE